MVADHQGCKHQGGIVVRPMAEIRFARGQRFLNVFSEATGKRARLRPIKRPTKRPTQKLACAPKLMICKRKIRSGDSDRRASPAPIILQMSTNKECRYRWSRLGDLNLSGTSDALRPTDAYTSPATRASEVRALDTPGRYRQPASRKS
jgi:hypothetical protein